MFDRDFGEEEPTVDIPELPYHDTTRAEQYQAYVSAYSIDGFFNSFIEVVGMKGWVNATEIPAGVPLTLNTGTINILLPGISDYYGSSQPVDVHFNVTSLGNFQVFEANSKMSGTTSLNLQFWVEKADSTKELACELNLSDMEFDFSALVTDMNITLNITKFNID